MRLLTMMAVFLLALVPSAVLADASGPDALPVEVMVLGTYHFANPGKDVVNVRVDDVLTPERQAELAALSQALAAFAPTVVAVEGTSDDPQLLDPGFAKFTPSDLASDRNETVQIGYRTAKVAGTARVIGFDAPGEFPIEDVFAFAESHGRSGEIEAIMAEVERLAREHETAQKDRSIPELLIPGNRPAEVLRLHSLTYQGLMSMGDAKEQPGAVFGTKWFERNARMFAKITAVAKPGDRVLVLVGSGHKYWLDEFARTTTGVASVDPVPFLERAAGLAAKR